MSYREITIVEMPNRTSRAIATEDATLRYRMQLVAAFLPAAAIVIAKLLAA